MPAISADAQAPQAHYQDLVAQLQEQYRAIPSGETVRLSKKTSNLFRRRSEVQAPGLDVAAFDGVLSVDPQAQTADVLGMTTYEHLVDATLPHGLMPFVVPQLKTITLGGAVTGLGIEASSFRMGLPHESVIEMDILTGAGEVVTVTNAPDDPNRALYLGFPNSYGSLGYALRIKIALMPVKPYVELRHVRFDSAEAMTEALVAITDSGSYDVGNHDPGVSGSVTVDFLDGTVFSAAEQYLTLGTFVDELPHGFVAPSDYTGMEIYYKSIQHRAHDVLTVRDYIWRWDTDWFWCSRAFGAQNPMVRKFWPKSKLRSDFYWKIIAMDRKYKLHQRQLSMQGKAVKEEVVQDIEIPVDRLPEFLDFFHREVGIEPIWICPLKSRDTSNRWPLYDMDPATTYVNVGFWSLVELPAGVDPDQGVINRKIETKVTRLGGHKSLYSSAYYERDEFYRLYGGEAYVQLKQTYDPDSRLLDLFDKVVKRK